MMLVQYVMWVTLREHREAILKGIMLKPTFFVLGVLASALMLALVGFGFGWFFSGQQIANLKEGPGSPSAISHTTAKPDATLPKADVPGEDFSDLPRYPGSVRVKYERRVSKAGLILFDTEIRKGLVETEIEVSEPQKEKAIQRDSASPQRPDQPTPAPSTTPPSDGDDDSGDGSEGD